MRKILVILFVVLWFAVGVQAQNKEFEKGTRAARAGKFERALSEFQIALEKTPKHTSPEFSAKLKYNIGVCLFRLNRSVEASENFHQAIETSAGNYQKAFYALGMAQTDLQNWQAARNAFEAAIRLKNDDGEAWFDLGLVLIEEKNFQSAAESFRQAIKYNSTSSPAAYNNLGVIAALNGDFAAAEKEFEIALALSNGKTIEAANNLAVCRLRLQNLSAKFEFSRLSN